MSFVIKHAPTGKYFHIKHFGLELFNIGINPKVYKTEDEANREILMFPALKDKQKQIYYNTKQGLKIFGKPKWYDERHTKKLTKKQTEKLEWYERCHEITEKNKAFLEQLKITDLLVEEYERSD
jgi:hypothetical protein